MRGPARISCVGDGPANNEVVGAGAQVGGRYLELEPHEAACRAKTCDILRYVLPAATLTNIGMTINGRLLEHLITKLLSHPLTECHPIGTLLKAEAEQVIPTLIKYAGVSDYLRETGDAMESLARARLSGIAPAEVPPVSLVRYPQNAEDRLVAAILYGYAVHSLAQIEERVRHLSGEEKARVVDEYLKRRGPHDQPLRALEHLTYTFDILVDFGAFRDIQRHRMLTQTPQESTAIHGYSRPPEMARYGLSTVFDEGMTPEVFSWDDASDNRYLASGVACSAW